MERLFMTLMINEIEIISVSVTSETFWLRGIFELDD